MAGDADKEADRLMALLDAGLKALREDDEVGCELALAEALKTANAMPKKAICLPDRSSEKGER